jgi:hypothetical protein
VSHLEEEDFLTISQVTGLEANVSLCNSVVYNGILYATKTCVIIRYEHDYVFGRIKNVTYYGGKVFCLCELLSVLEFNTHLHCYIVEKTTTSIFIPTEDLSPFPLSLYPYDNDQYIIIMRHFVQVPP